MLWCLNELPTVICSTPELKWGPHNKGDDRPLTVPDIMHQKANLLLPNYMNQHNGKHTISEW